MASYLCHFCKASSVFPKYAVAVFTSFVVQPKFASRIEDLLDVEVLPNDGLPQHIRLKCKRRLETLEIHVSAADLQNFHSQANGCYETLVTLRRGPV